MTITDIAYNENLNTSRPMLDSQKNYLYSSDDILHVVTVLSNPCHYNRRVKLMLDFIERMEYYGGLSKRNGLRDKKGYELYVVELAYGNDEYSVTSPNNKKHLQLRTEHPMWHKENMINLGISRLLPENWKYVAWIDSDIEFDSFHWVDDIKFALYHDYDILQPFSNALDLDSDGKSMSIYQSFGYKHTEGLPHSNKKDVNYWHPGYAWACTRDYFNCIKRLYDIDILGSADYRMSHAILNKLTGDYSPGYKFLHERWCGNIPANVKLGYVPGTIRHYYHGTKENRKYIERNEVLRKYKYNPLIHIDFKNGLLVPTKDCPKEFLIDILKYFSERKEDD